MPNRLTRCVIVAVSLVLWNCPLKADEIIFRNVGTCDMTSGSMTLTLISWDGAGWITFQPWNFSSIPLREGATTGVSWSGGVYTYTFWHVTLDNVDYGTYLMHVGQTITIPVFDPDCPPLTVAITSPANNAVLPPPPGSTTITATATPAKSGETVSQVAFYYSSDGQTWTDIASASTPPYAVIWSPAAPGTYSIKAVATDNNGANVTAAPVSVQVDSGLIDVQFGNPDLGTALQTGGAAIGLSSSDYWNLIEGWDGQDAPTFFDIGDGEGDRGIYASTLADSAGGNSGVVISIMADQPNLGDAPVGNGWYVYGGYPLFFGDLLTAGHDYEISVQLPTISSGSYDLYLYSAVSIPSTFTLYSGYDDTGTQYGSSQTPSSSSNADISQYVEFTGLSGGLWTVKISGGADICNGLQIHRN